DRYFRGRRKATADFSTKTEYIACSHDHIHRIFLSFDGADKNPAIEDEVQLAKVSFIVSYEVWVDLHARANKEVIPDYTRTRRAVQRIGNVSHQFQYLLAGIIIRLFKVVVLE